MEVSPREDSSTEVSRTRIHDARPPDTLHELLTGEAVLLRLGISWQRLYWLVAKGSLHPVRVGGRIKYLDFEVAAVPPGEITGRYFWRPEFTKSVEAVA